MRVKGFLILFFLLSCGVAKADVQPKTTCYFNVPRDNSSRHVELALRTYEDMDLKKEIGAFVQYRGSKETIPLVFNKYTSTDTDSPELGNYEISRIEISKNKVTGEYVVIQTGAGIRQGKYVKYTNFKTGRSMIFMATGEDDPSCKIDN
jgi:hypothetical protein